MKRIENPKNTERGRNAIPPRREFISPTHLFFYFPFLTQLQTAFIIGTSYAIAKLAPKRGYDRTHVSSFARYAQLRLSVTKEYTSSSFSNTNLLQSKFRLYNIIDKFLSLFLIT